MQPARRSWAEGEGHLQTVAFHPTASKRLLWELGVARRRLSGLALATSFGEASPKPWRRRGGWELSATRLSQFEADAFEDCPVAFVSRLRAAWRGDRRR